MSDFSQVFRDDFNGSQLDRGIWKAVYSGEYHNEMFRWDPSQIQVGDGRLTIATERAEDGWVSGGLATIPDGQTYGSYEFRARVDAGQGTAAAILLWPSDNEWTDEVDIVETHRPDREAFAFTNHGDPQVTEYIDTDVSQWHTYRLDWTPGELTLWVDGQQKSRITTDVPEQSMSFGVQGQVMADHETWFGGGPDGSTPDRVEIELDWVKVSAWTPGEGDSGNTPATPPAEAEAGTEAEFAAPAQSSERQVAEPAAAESGDPWAQYTVNGQIDWEAAAAAVQANYEATGQWFL